MPCVGLSRLNDSDGSHGPDDSDGEVMAVAAVPVVVMDTMMMMVMKKVMVGVMVATIC